MSGEVWRYAGFISYSHAQRDFAQWLQTRLEWYRPPKNSGDFQITERAGRISPIYRDREELGASTSLSDAIRRALAESAFLIVIASEQAAQSPWVEEEVKTFIELGRADRIWIAIPPAPRNAPVALDFKAIVPPSLRNAGVPLAADFRSVGDGRGPALLRLVSAMSGLDFAVLRDRDGRRQRFRLAIGTVALSIVAASVGAASLTVVQEFQRRQSLVQTAQGEQARSAAQEEIANIRALFSASREREALARLFALDVRSLSEREQRAVERVRRFWSRELSAPEDVAQLTGVGAKATLRGENFFRTRAGLLRVPIDARIEVLSGGQLGVVHIGPLTEPHSAGVIDIETGAPLFTNAQIGMHATSVAVLQNRSALVSGYDAAREPILRLRYGNRSLSESFFHRPSWASADCSIGIFLFAGADARGSLDRNDRTDARLVQVFNEGPARRGTLDAGAASVRVAINGQRVRGYAVPVSQSGEALDITARVLGIGFVSLDGALLSSATFPAGASPASAFAGMRDILQGRKRFLDCEAEMSDTVFQNSEGGANLDPPYFRGRLAHIDQAQTLSRYFAEQAGLRQVPEHIVYGGPTRGGTIRVVIFGGEDGLRSCAVANGRLSNCVTRRDLFLYRAYPQAGLLVVKALSPDGESTIGAPSFVNLDRLAEVGDVPRVRRYDYWAGINFLEASVEGAGDGVLIDGWEGPGDTFARVALDEQGALVRTLSAAQFEASFLRFMPIGQSDVVLFGGALSRVDLVTGRTRWTYGERLVRYDDTGDYPLPVAFATSPDESIIAFRQHDIALRLFDAELGLPLGMSAGVSDETASDFGYGGYEWDDVLTVDNSGAVALHTRNGTLTSAGLELTDAVLSAEQVACRIAARVRGEDVELIDVVGDREFRRSCGFDRFFASLEAAPRIQLD